MQQNKQIIQFSDHIKNKIKSQRQTSFSFSSDELILSDDNGKHLTKRKNLSLFFFFFPSLDSLISTVAEKTFRKRSSTFVTYQVQPRIQSESYFSTKRIDSKKETQLCQECLRREKLLQTEHENFSQLQKENKKLSEQIHSLNLIHQQYQDENNRLKQHLTKMNFHLHEYQIHLNLLKQKIISDKNIQNKQNLEDQHLRRLRHEVQVYNQVIAEKRKEEEKQIDYYYHFRNK